MSSRTLLVGVPGAERAPLGAGLLVATGALVLAVLVSIAVGAKSIPLGTVLDALTGYWRRTPR